MERYRSQYKQDRYLDTAIFKKKRGGVFVDIGAHDGVDLSNTYFFEKDRGWSGVCIEPRKSAFEALRKNRACTAEQVCVSDHTGTQDFLEIEGSGAMLSGLVDTYQKEHRSRVAERHADDKKSVISVPCEPLENILKRHHITQVDYCSVDTEGSEEKILASTDLSRIPIDVLTIENNYGERSLRRMMRNKGYVFVTSIGCDDVYMRAAMARRHWYRVLSGRTTNAVAYLLRRLEHLKVIAYNTLKRMGITGHKANARS